MLQWRHLQLAAELRVVMRPIIVKMPLVGGLQIFFLNSPDMDFELEGIASVPGFKHFLKRRILKIMSSKLVFPNKIPVKLSKSLDAAELKSVEPEVNFIFRLKISCSSWIFTGCSTRTRFGSEELRKEGR